jgi:hypothetical protein
MWLFINKAERRTLLAYGALGMGSCHFVIGGVRDGNHVDVPGDVGNTLNPNILTLGPECWIYAAEVWSLGTRARVR